uniref:Uncharacterized protein n=1 Tax=Ditylenchus dipsaci TaxID=166011 RepID=A0A915DUV3_9BILA
MDKPRPKPRLKCVTFAPSCNAADPIRAFPPASSPANINPPARAVETCRYDSIELWTPSPSPQWSTGSHPLNFSDYSLYPASSASADSDGASGIKSTSVDGGFTNIGNMPVHHKASAGNGSAGRSGKNDTQPQKTSICSKQRVIYLFIALILFLILSAIIYLLVHSFFNQSRRRRVK